jgi:nitrate reductase assembly molybdenum cofactor insertion protein NarJ
MAEIFRYPSGKLKEDILFIKDTVIGRYHPGLVAKLLPFSEYINSTPLSQQEEYYTSTFDVQPVSTLDIGYVLFGDDYRRGVFLVNIKKEHIKTGNDCGSELPDHLPNILTLLPLIKDEKMAEELSVSLLIPALEEIISRFKNAGNHYKGLLELLLEIMKTDFSDSSFERFQVKANKVYAK